MLLLWVRMAGPRSRPVLREPQEEAAAHGGCSEEENRLGKKDIFFFWQQGLLEQEVARVSAPIQDRVCFRLLL